MLQDAPHPRRFFFESRSQSDVLRRVTAPSDGRQALVTVTGAEGVGKSMCCAEIARRLRPASTVVVVDALTLDGVFGQLLHYFTDDRDVQVPADADERRRDLVLALRRHLTSGHATPSVVVLVDDAERLERDALAWMVALPNLAVGPARILRVVLVGSPELDTLLNGAEFREGLARGRMRCRLTPLRRAELLSYIERRVVGTSAREGEAGKGGALFTRAALWTLFRASGGVPVTVNRIASRAIALGAAKGAARVDRAMVHEAVTGARAITVVSRGLVIRIAAVVVAVAAVALAVWWWRATAGLARPAPEAPAPVPPIVAAPAVPEPPPSEPSVVAPAEAVADPIVPSPPVVAPADVSATVAPTAPALPAPSVATPVATRPSSVSPPPVGTGRLVAVGAFRSEKNANDIVASLAAVGLPAFVRHDAARGWHSVYVGPYATVEEARAIVPRLRSEFAVRDAVVLGDRPVAPAPSREAMPSTVPPPGADAPAAQADERATPPAVPAPATSVPPAQAPAPQTP